MKGIRSSVLIVAACIGLFGCGSAAQLAGYMPSIIGSTAGMAVRQNQSDNMTPKMDAESLDVHLAVPTTDDAFIKNAKEVVNNLGYQLARVDTRLVVAMKTESKTGFMGFGWSYQSTNVTIRLEPDGQLIKISATMTGTGGKADSGTANKLASEFQKSLQQRYAAGK